MEKENLERMLVKSMTKVDEKNPYGYNCMTTLREKKIKYKFDLMLKFVNLSEEDNERMTEMKSASLVESSLYGGIGCGFLIILRNFFKNKFLV